MPGNKLDGMSRQHLNSSFVYIADFEIIQNLRNFIYSSWMFQDAVLATMQG